MSAAEMEEYVRKVVAPLALSDQRVEVGTRFSLAVVSALQLPSVPAELSCVICIARLWKIEVIPVMGIDQKACLVWDKAAVERTLCMSLMAALLLEDGFVVGSTAEFVATVWAAGEQPGKTGAPAHCFTGYPVKHLKFPRCSLSQVVQEVIVLPLWRLSHATMEQNELPPDTFRNCMFLLRKRCTRDVGAVGNQWGAAVLS
jgi:hypothetical protein